MHIPRSDKSLWMLRTTAWLTCLRPVLLAAVVVMMGASAYTRSSTVLALSLKVAGAVLVLCAAHWLVRRKARCPLCATPVMGGVACSKHRRARHLLGSHAIRTAVDILLRGQFLCPYCGESTAMLRRAQRGEFRMRSNRHREEGHLAERDLWKDM